MPVKIEAGKATETVALINWDQPQANNFAIAEEVTLRGNHERRPDLVLYVNSCVGHVASVEEFAEADYALCEMTTRATATNTISSNAVALKSTVSCF